MHEQTSTTRNSRTAMHRPLTDEEIVSMVLSLGANQGALVQRIRVQAERAVAPRRPEDPGRPRA